MKPATLVFILSFFLFSLTAVQAAVVSKLPVDGINGTNGLNGTNGINGLNGSNGANGLNGNNGTNGFNGTGISFIYILSNGSLQINLTDGRNITSGNLTGQQGIQGISGINGSNGVNGSNGLNGTGITSIYVLTNGSLQINLSNGVNITTGNLTGQQGTQGTSGINGTNGLNGTNGINGLNGSNGLNATANWTLQTDSGINQTVGNAQTLHVQAFNCLISNTPGSLLWNLLINATCLENSFFDFHYLQTNSSGWLNNSNQVYLANNATNVTMNGVLWVDVADGMVGVNTINPSHDLTVNDTIRVGNRSDDLIIDTDGFYRLTGSNSNFFIGRNVASDTVFFTNGNNSQSTLEVNGGGTLNLNTGFEGAVVVGDELFPEDNNNLLGNATNRWNISVTKINGNPIDMIGNVNMSLSLNVSNTIIENSSRVCTTKNNLCANSTTGITGNFTVVETVNLLALTSTSCTFRFINGTLRSTTC